MFKSLNLHWGGVCFKELRPENLFFPPDELLKTKKTEKHAVTIGKDLEPEVTPVQCRFQSKSGYFSSWNHGEKPPPPKIT